MLLYHGSNVEVASPRIITPNRALDFGAGFYTTSDLGQARRWASVQAKRRRTGSPVVSVFEFDSKTASESLDTLVFSGADTAWLGHVVANRRAEYEGRKHDLVVGPVANDNTMPVINDFMAGVIDERTALVLLRPQRLADQYAFLTAKALGHLVFKEATRYDD